MCGVNTTGRLAPVTKASEKHSPYSAALGRIPITQVGPSVDGGRWPARCAAGEMVPITATVFREGHDAFGAEAVLLAADGSELARERMTVIDQGFDVHQAWVCPEHAGPHTFHIEAWHDPFATWQHNATVKIAANVDVELMFLEGQQLLTQAMSIVPKDGAQWTLLHAAASALQDTTRPAQARLAAAVGSDVTAVLREFPLRELVTFSAPHQLMVMRRLAATSAWYEIFPRSVGAERTDESGPWQSGTFKKAQELLPYVAGMGFNVIYTPPIHPIGKMHRKGPNNTLTPGPHDPGSPYAIGSAEGGHKSVHPELGTLQDYKDFIKQARKLDLEVALDLALQCAPDHPWVTEHPDWFVTRLDGTIAYAENPPKKYQDIYPLNFDLDPQGIYAEVLDVVLHWIDAGVTLFRVDNPHTKPVEFWEWLIREVNAKHPEVIFLAEAFTKPEMMRTLAKIGFQQSYTYFTWRNTPAELAQYVTELSTGGHVTTHGTTGTADYMRPNFWPTTPDILTPFMQDGGRSAHKIRAILAATLSPSWGIYGGYELIEDVPRYGAQEHINSEKYEFRPRDFAAAEACGHSIAPLLRTLNTIRRTNPAILQLRAVRFHHCTNSQLLAYSHYLPARFSPSGVSNTVITVVNMNPHQDNEGIVHLNLNDLDLPSGQGFVVHDIMTDQRFTWSDEFFVRLSADQPAHVCVVEGQPPHK